MLVVSTKMRIRRSASSSTCSSVSTSSSVSSVSSVVRGRRRGGSGGGVVARGSAEDNEKNGVGVGSQARASAVLYCRDTRFPSFNMTPSLLLGREPGDETQGKAPRVLRATKRIVLLRHGQSEWNAQGRIQGDTNMSNLTEEGVRQAERCARALASIDFDACFYSPLMRAERTARIVWGCAGSQDDGGGGSGAAPLPRRDKRMLVSVDQLKEAHLYDLQGLTNEDAARLFPERYEAWRNDPGSLCMKGRFPVIELFINAREAWDRIVSDDRFSDILVISHKVRARENTSCICKYMCTTYVCTYVFYLADIIRHREQLLR